MRKARQLEGINFWPGYVDALTNLVLNLLFIVGIFAVAIFVMNLSASKNIKQEVKAPVVSSKRNVARIGFLKDAILFTDEQKKLIDATIKKAPKGKRWQISASTPFSDIELKRRAYLRVLSVRSLLINAGVGMKDIDLLLTDSNDQKAATGAKDLSQEMPVFIDIFDGPGERPS